MQSYMAEAEGGGDNNFLWGAIAVIFLLMVIGTIIGRIGFLNNEDGISGQTLVASDNIQAGDEIVNSSAARVRQSAGGAIIGEQEKRERGTIVEGPISVFGQKWFRIDYEEAPDGWVAAEDVTNKIGLFRTLNIFPIIFDAIRPVAYTIIIILVILILFVLFKQRQVAHLVQKKKEVALESARRREGKIPEEVVATEVTDDDSGSVGAISGVPSNLPIGELPSGLHFERRGVELTPTGPKNKRWGKIERLMESYNTGDWKQAIIEADIMLDEMLNRIGYKGDSIGDKLKQIEISDFVTLNKAWEAHKFRNHVAHKGMDFTFSKSEAERIINLYRQVFEEFYYI